MDLKPRPKREDSSAQMAFEVRNKRVARCHPLRIATGNGHKHVPNA